MIFAATIFVKVLFVVPIISSHVITESSIILLAYLPFLQLHVAAFQIYIYFFAHMMFFFYICTHTNINLCFSFELQSLQAYIHICMINVLLIF